MAPEKSKTVLADAPVLEAARGYYLRRGWAVVPIPRGEKAPRARGWPSLRLGKDDLPQHFSNGSSHAGTFSITRDSAVVPTELPILPEPRWKGPNRTDYRSKNVCTRFWNTLGRRKRTVNTNRPGRAKRTPGATDARIGRLHRDPRWRNRSGCLILWHSGAKALCWRSANESRPEPGRAGKDRGVRHSAAKCELAGWDFPRARAQAGGEHGTTTQRKTISTA